MSLNDLTIREVKEIQSMFKKDAEAESHSLIIGEAVLIRTVTLHYTGRIKAVTRSDVVLTDAAWIANTGRFATALKQGLQPETEVEPFCDDVIVNRDVIVDVTKWRHALPRDQK